MGWRRAFAEHLDRYPRAHGLLVGWPFAVLIAFLTNLATAIVIWGCLVVILVTSAVLSDRERKKSEAMLYSGVAAYRRLREENAEHPIEIDAEEFEEARRGREEAEAALATLRSEVLEDDPCACGHVRHEHHFSTASWIPSPATGLPAYSPDPECGPETGRCAHCDCERFALDQQEER